MPIYIYIQPYSLSETAARPILTNHNSAAHYQDPVLFLSSTVTAYLLSILSSSPKHHTTIPTLYFLLIFTTPYQFLINFSRDFKEHQYLRLGKSEKS
ncbi:hypothetical protein RchiOBHm_Chr6g0248491 [Rosa chinensis]|uniref:Uncharacterized protein n=1 Tax=Rosa chinensis TaxID=74649 RepID=A0A2P6PK18_ROSCH|nr:hypothetical protein RchiOBHm_Chr6g0248491 [Rosa chinensis]